MKRVIAVRAANGSAHPPQAMLAPARLVRSPAAISADQWMRNSVSRASANVSAVLGNGAQDIDGVTVEQLVALADGVAAA